MNMDREVIPFTQGGELLHRVVRHGIRRMRTHRDMHHRVTPEVLNHFPRLLQIFVVSFRPGGGETDKERGDRALHAALAKPRRGVHREEVMVVRAGDAALHHFLSGEAAAFVHEFRAHQAAFKRPHLFLQPVHQTKVRADAAKQIHGGVRMQVNETRHHDFAWQLHDFLRLKLRGFGFRNDCRDLSIRDRDHVLCKHNAFGDNRDDPGRLQKSIHLHAVITSQSIFPVL
jgi:hypothetical protein